MSQVARPLFATVSLLTLWFVAFALQGLGMPVWTVCLTCGFSAVNLIVLMGLFHQVTLERDPGDGGRGIAGDRPDAPDAGPGGELSWWPEFERELAEYSAAPRDLHPERVPVGSVDVA